MAESSGGRWRPRGPRPDPASIDEVAGLPVGHLRVGLVEDLGMSEGSAERRLSVLKNAEAICRSEGLSLATLAGGDVQRVVALMSDDDRRRARPALGWLWEVLGRQDSEELPGPAPRAVQIGRVSAEALEELRALARAREHLDRRIAEVVAIARRSVGVVGRVEQILGRRLDLDVESLYADVLWELGEYGHRPGGGSAGGAAAVVQRVARRYGVLGADRLTLPRLPRNVVDDHKGRPRRWIALALDELIATIEGENHVGPWLELADLVGRRQGWRLSAASDGLATVFFTHKTSGAWARAGLSSGKPEFTVFRQNSPNPDDVDWWSFAAIADLDRYLPVFERGGLLPEATSRRPRSGWWVETVPGTCGEGERDGEHGAGRRRLRGATRREDASGGAGPAAPAPAGAQDDRGLPDGAGPGRRLVPDGGPGA